MPSKLKKAIGAVKDQTSISLAKVSNNNVSNLQVMILKATRHDDSLIDERYVLEILSLISSNKVYAAACAQAIAKRVGKTRNWIVALKSLNLVLRIFQDGDPYFPREVLLAMNRGAKIVNLTNFRDDTSSCAWDFTAFIRMFSLYLEERLDCFIRGKLQRRFTNRQKEEGDPNQRRNSRTFYKPAVLLDRIAHWQKLLNRAVATRPTGAARLNRLVRISLYSVVQETFDLYQDISDGIAVLLDGFFHLQHEICEAAYETCVKASKQFEELCSFYELCKNIGVGRSSEYPNVQKISIELMETLQEFLKDQSTFPSSPASRSHTHLMLPPPPATIVDSHDKLSNKMEKHPTKESIYRSRCTSLEDLLNAPEEDVNPRHAMERHWKLIAKRYLGEDTDDRDAHSEQNEQGTISNNNNVTDLLCLDDWPDKEDQNQNSMTSVSDGWETLLAETANRKLDDATGLESLAIVPYSLNQDPVAVSNELTIFCDQDKSNEHRYNPFLQDSNELPIITTWSNHQEEAAAAFPVDDWFSAAPTFQASQVSTWQATPTFSAASYDNAMADSWGNELDLFGYNDSITMVNGHSHDPNHFTNQQSLFNEQQLWLQQQNKIIEKNTC